MTVGEGGPYPLAPNDLSTIYIVSKKVATGATTEDFNSGKAAIGSGRFKLVRYVNGDRVELVRNDAYWGEKPVWDKVTFKIIKNEASRVAALLSGDVDAIGQIDEALRMRRHRHPGADDGDAMLAHGFPLVRDAAANRRVRGAPVAGDLVRWLDHLTGV